MKFKRITNDPPLTPYAPQWDYTFGTTVFKNVNLSTLAQTCLEKEKEIKKLPVMYGDYKSPKNVNDGNTGLGKNSTTSKYQSYNVLDWKTPETKQLKSNIASSLLEYTSYLKNPPFSETWITCWVNILRWGQRINPHLHATGSDSYLSGHFNVQSGETSTCYMSSINHLTCSHVVDYPNIPGEMILFPSYIHHYTTRHYSFKPRITIAFDLKLYKAYNTSILL